MAAGSASRINKSSDTLMDLGFARMLFRAMLRWSRLLGIDADKRPLWTDLLSSLAPFPTERDESGGSVFGSSSGANDTFPIASQCYSNWSKPNASGFYRAGLSASEMDLSGCEHDALLAHALLFPRALTRRRLRARP